MKDQQIYDSKDGVGKITKNRISEDGLDDQQE